MHVMERLLDNDTTSTESRVFDLREHVSMSLQIKGLTGGTTATLYGTLFEKEENFLPVTIQGSTIISADNLYVVPPYYRFYKLVLNRTNNAPIKAYLYAIKQGAFIARVDGSLTPSGSDDEFSKIRLSQQGLMMLDTSLTDTHTDIITPLVIPANQDFYLSYASLSLQGQAGADIEITSTINSVESTIKRYSLTGQTPTIIDPIYFLDKIDHTGYPLTLRIKSHKFMHNYDAHIYGRIVYFLK